MYFAALIIDLRFTDRRGLTFADAAYAHAAILTMITEVDEVVGRALHDMQRHKHFTLAIVENQPENVKLRLSFLSPKGLEYAQLLVVALQPPATLRIGRVLCEISQILLGSSTWSGIATWADMTVDPTGQWLRFFFETPTAITKQDGNGVRFTALLPDPVDVFSGLARRWNSLEGPPLPNDLDDFLKSGGCVIANYHLRTIKFRTPEWIQIGFVGSVVYECRKHSQSHLAALCALTRLAFFTGVGYQTARGMGLTRTLITS